MASSESLNASQRAVLQLLLRQGKSYAEIAGLLNTETDAARARAHGAVAALAPAPAALPADRAAELIDHLLGQQTDAERAATRSLLEGSAPARAWARTAADALRPLAGRQLPEIPPDPGTEPTAEAPAPKPQPEAASTPASKRAEPRSDAPASVPTSGPDGNAGPRPAADRARRLSPMGLRVLVGGLAAVAAIAIAIVVVLVTSSEDGATPAAATTTTTPTTTTPTAGPGAVIIAQADLRAPQGGVVGARGQAGIVLLRESRRYRFAVQAGGLPATTQRSAAYGVWLYTDAKHSQFLGLADAVVGGDGRLDAVRDLSPDTPTFREVLLTREVSQSPEQPGPVVLRGDLVTAAAASSDGRQPTTTTP